MTTPKSAWFAHNSRSENGFIVVEETGAAQRCVCKGLSEKDALLISAAPNLLWAAHVALSLLNESKSATKSPGGLEAVATLRMAIAKAKGRG